ncbi:MAG: FecR family protein, partial [Opitutaceae bacterium]
VLPDGSVAELNQGAQFTIDFSAGSQGARTVSLTKGEAHFQVAKLPERPFVVRVAGVSFRAVGTAFSVGLSGSSIEMLVTEGRVAVETREGGADSRNVAAVVDAGNRVVVDAFATQTLAVSAVSAAVSQQKLAWRIPRLEFNETPLSEVVGLLNQHSGKWISLATADLGRLQISGALRADNIEPLLQILETTYRIKVNRLPNGEIVLVPDR